MDTPQAIPLTADPIFRAAVIGLIGSLTTLAAGIAGWFMRERKTKKDAETAPGYALRRESDKKLQRLEVEVSDLGKGLKELGEKVDDLAEAAVRTGERMDRLDEKVDEAAKSNHRLEVTVAEVANDMEWVKKTLDAIGKKLGV